MSSLATAKKALLQYDDSCQQLYDAARILSPSTPTVDRVLRTGTISELQYVVRSLFTDVKGNDCCTTLAIYTGTTKEDYILFYRNSSLLLHLIQEKAFAENVVLLDKENIITWLKPHLQCDKYTRIKKLLAFIAAEKSSNARLWKEYQYQHIMILRALAINVLLKAKLNKLRIENALIVYTGPTKEDYVMFYRKSSLFLHLVHEKTLADIVVKHKGFYTVLSDAVAKHKSKYKGTVLSDHVLYGGDSHPDGTGVLQNAVVWSTIPYDSRLA